MINAYLHIHIKYDTKRGIEYGNSGLSQKVEEKPWTLKHDFT